MKQLHRLFLPLIVLLLCFMNSLTVLAQANLSEIVKRVKPSTVVILTYDKKGKLLSQGSGFFISREGDVITNSHVFQGASRAEVKTTDGKVYIITRVVIEDKEADLIRVSVNIPTNGAHFLSESKSLPEVGERIIVIGSPLGLEQTVSDGIISAFREIPGFGKVIQITAPISPGSSGSPVVNMKGEVIGVATFLMLEGQNLNFAISGERLARLVSSNGKSFAEWQMGKIEKWTSSAEGFYHSGLAFVGQAKYEKALPYFEAATKKNPRYAEAFFMIGYCNGQLGRYLKEIEAFNQAIRFKPDYDVAFKNLGMRYHELGRYQEAIEAFNQLIRIKPGDDYAHVGLGTAYYSGGRHIEAIEAFKQAIRITPDDAKTYFGLGMAYIKLNRLQEALEAIKQGIRINPDSAQAYVIIGGPYIKLGRYQEAIEAYKQGIRIKPDFADAHQGLGLAYNLAGRYQEAIEAFKQAIRITPDNANAHYYLGLTYLQLEDQGSALNEYSILKNLDKDLANKLFNKIYK